MTKSQMFKAAQLLATATIAGMTACSTSGEAPAPRHEFREGGSEGELPSQIVLEADADATIRTDLDARTNDDAGGVAWSAVDANNQAQPDFDPAVAASVTIEQATHAVGDVVEMDITELVNGWLSGAYPNEGLLLRDVTTDGVFRGVVFGSRSGLEDFGEVYHPTTGDLLTVPGPELALEVVPESCFDIEIVADGSQSTLWWQTEPELVYSVYRSTNPNFSYDGPDSTLLQLVVLGDEYVDDYALDLDDPLDPGDSHDVGVFYKVVARSPGMEVMYQFPTVGRTSSGYVTSLEINPWVSRRFSKVPLCLEPTPSYTTLEQLDSQHYEVTAATQATCFATGISPEYCEMDLGTINPVGAIHWWDALGPLSWMPGNWVSPESFYPVLDRELGEVLALEGVVLNIPPYPDNGDGSHGYNHYFQLTGRVPEPCEMLAPLAGGNNDLVWPVTAGATTAQDLLEAIDGAAAIGYWDQPEQRIRWYPAVPDDDLPTATVPGGVTEDFAVEPCDAVYLHIDAATPDGEAVPATWPPGIVCP